MKLTCCISISNKTALHLSFSEIPLCPHTTVVALEIRHPSNFYYLFILLCRMPRYSSRAGVELININPALPVSSRFNAKLFNHHQYSNHHRTNSPVSTQPFGDLSPHLFVLPVDCYAALLEQPVYLPNTRQC